MEITIDFVSARFSAFNQAYFGSALPIPRFRLSNVRSYLGQMRQRRRGAGRVSWMEYTLTVNTHYEMIQTEIEDVILHEMIHYYIMVKGVRDTSPHGIVFRRWMDTLNQRHGRHISVRSEARHETAEAKKKLRQVVVCVCRLQSGETGLLIPATTRIYQFRCAIRTIPDIVSARWYVSRSEALNAYPRARTLKLYLVDSHTAEQLLAGAEPIDEQGQ